MRMTSRVLLPALLLFASPLEAQQRDLWTEYDGPRRLEFAVNGGVFLSSDWSDLLFIETFGGAGNPQRQVLLREFAMAPEFGGTASVTYWRGRYGFRVHAGFVRSCLTTGDGCESSPPASTGLGDAAIDMDTYAYGVQGVVGLIEHTQGQWFRPYLIVGAGGVTNDLASPLTSILPGPFSNIGPARVSGGDRTFILDDPTTLMIQTDEVGLETRFALNLGVGTDFRIPVGPGGLGLRLELSDQISQSPIALRVARLDGGGIHESLIDEVEFNGRTVHNWRLSAGLVFEFGLRGYQPPPSEY
jgi:hypothetical protein